MQKTSIINLVRGATAPWSFVWTDDGDVTRDLTGCTLTLHDNASCPDFTAAIGDPVNGEVILTPGWPDDAALLAMPDDLSLRLRLDLTDGDADEILVRISLREQPSYLNIDRGDTEPWRITWTDVDGEPRSLIGATVDIFDNALCPQWTIDIDASGGFAWLRPGWPAGLTTVPAVFYLRPRVVYADGIADPMERLVVYAR